MENKIDLLDKIDEWLDVMEFIDEFKENNPDLMGYVNEKSDKENDVLSVLMKVYKLGLRSDTYTQQLVVIGMMILVLSAGQTDDLSLKKKIISKSLSLKSLLQ